VVGVNQNGNPNRRILGALDADLPLLATRAAIELDRLLAGEDIGLESVTTLADLLAGSAEAQPGQPARSVMDPATITVMNRVISDYYEKPQSLAELAQRSLDIAKSFPTTHSSSPEKSKLENLRQFCIALSMYAASYRQSLFGSGVKHPFRI